MKKIILVIRKSQIAYFIYTRKPDKVLKVSNSVITKYPNSVIGYYGKSVGLLQKQLYRKAIEMFDQTISMIKEINNRRDKILYLADCYTKIGQSYYELGDYNQAIRCFDDSINIDPDDDWQAYFYRASAKFKKQLYQEALDDFYKVLDFKKHQQETLENIRVVQERMNE